MKSKPLSPSSEAFRSNRVDSCCFIKSTYFSFKSFNSLVLSSKCVRSSLRDSISYSLGILEYTSFSSSESDLGSAYEVTVATNPTTTFASSSASSLSDPESLSKSFQVAIKLCLICFLNLFNLKVDFLDFSFDFSF